MKFEIKKSSINFPWFTLRIIVTISLSMFTRFLRCTTPSLKEKNIFTFQFGQPRIGSINTSYFQPQFNQNLTNAINKIPRVLVLHYIHVLWFFITFLLSNIKVVRSAVVSILKSILLKDRKIRNSNFNYVLSIERSLTIVWKFLPSSISRPAHLWA